MRWAYRDTGQALENRTTATEDLQDSNMLSLGLPLGTVGEMGDLDMLGEFNFDECAIEMNSSDAAFLHVAFEVQDTFAK